MTTTLIPRGAAGVPAEVSDLPPSLERSRSRSFGRAVAGICEILEGFSQEDAQRVLDAAANLVGSPAAAPSEEDRLDTGIFK